MSKTLVGALEPATAAIGLNDASVGVFVVAILGNAAEHSIAVVAAMKDRMDLSLSIAIGSSVQVALLWRRCSCWSVTRLARGRWTSPSLTTSC
ncbi:MAG: hypothetical protein ACREXX_17610 [Gammaproteobacteria bacterium]